MEYIGTQLRPRLYRVAGISNAQTGVQVFVAAHLEVLPALMKSAEIHIQ